jgi:hypothetical protein
MKLIISGFVLATTALATSAWTIPGQPSAARSRPLERPTEATASHSLPAVGGDHDFTKPPALSSSCDGPPQHWLALSPSLFQVCDGATYYFPALGSSGRFDINGDGALEFVECLSQFEPLWGGQTQTVADVAWESVLEVSDTVPLARKRSVFRPGTATGAAIRDQFPTAVNARIYVIGWRDMDADGDLDLAAYLQVDPGSSSGSNVNIYFENIGFERPPPLAADLNQDGYVNGLDLGLLLGQWGPST